MRWKAEFDSDGVPWLPVLHIDPHMSETEQVDARGLLCPLPVLRLRKRLLSLPQGTRLKLIATDPAAIIDVPHFCAQSGHRLVATRGLGDGVTEFTVEKGPVCAMDGGDVEG